MINLLNFPYNLEEMVEEEFDGRKNVQATVKEELSEKKNNKRSKIPNN